MTTNVHRYSISVSGHEKEGIPSLSATFGRVTVLLGANGSGKSRLLGFLRGNRSNDFGGQRPHVFVEGGRVVSLPNHLQLDHNTVGTHGTYQQALKQYNNKVGGKVVSRVHDALFVLERKGDEDRGRHSDAVSLWQEQGCKGPCPERAETPLGRLFRLFGSIFPTLKLEYDRPNLSVQKGTYAYSPSSLSDGERQVLIALADIAILTADNAVIFVDEPELNLHPALAESLWSTIEADRPGCVFVYATHAVNFALRNGVDSVIVLSSRGSPVCLESPREIPSEELKPFLGSIAAILRTDRALLVEGTDASLDSPFYKWIVRDVSAEVVPMGDCHQVTAAVERSGVWSRLGASMKLTGVVDRDYRTDSELGVMKKKGCHVLELHEAESYLCVPELLVALGSKLRLVEAPPIQAFEDRIVKYASGQVALTAAARTVERTTVRLSVSASRQTLAGADQAKCIQLLRTAAEDEAKKLGGAIGADRVEAIFNEEFTRCAGAVEQRSIKRLLAMFPGKELLPELAHMIGVRDPKQLLSAAAGHLDPNAFDLTKELRSALSA